VAGVTRNADHRTRGNSLANTASTSRSAGVNPGRATCLRNTISWCRRTAISTSFASDAGPIPSSPSTRRSSTNPTLPITPGDHAISASALLNGVTCYLHPSRAPGPLRAFYQRVNVRRGFQKAVVATARKMTVLVWHLATKD
jgi:hypothetical protein